MTRRAPPLIGRETVLAEATAALLADTGARIVCVTGVAGMGRTAFVNAVGERLADQERPVAIRRATGVSWESDAAYALIHQLMPELRGTRWDSPFDAAAALVAVVESNLDDDGHGTMTVLLVDDAHLADKPSLRALSTAARHYRSAPFAALLTRPLGGSTGTGTLLGRVADRTVRLRPLEAQQVGELAALRGLPLPPSMAEHLGRHTDGVPGHIVALLDTQPRNVWKQTEPALPAPPDVEFAVRQRLERCSQPARALVEAVAVLKGPATVPDAAAVAQITDAVAAADEAERRLLLRMADGPGTPTLQMWDALVRTAVLTVMGPARRSALHGSASKVVDDAAACVAHAIEASPFPDADLADRAAMLAEERGRHGEWESAAELFTLAARATTERGQRESRLLRAVDSLVGAGNVPAATAYVPEVESLRESPMRSAVLGYLAILRGRPQDAEVRLTRAWELVSRTREPDVAALICQRRVLHHLSRCQGAELVRWADSAVELVGSEDPTAVEAQAIRGLGLGATGHTAEALASYRQLWNQSSLGAVGQRVQMGSGWLHLATDQIDLARAELETAVPVDFLGGSTRISLWARAWLARTYFVTGEWDAALRTVTPALELAARSGTTLIMPLLHWTATQIFALRGEWGRAADSLRLGEAGARDYEIMRMPSLLARAAMAEARADYASVLRALAPLAETWASRDVDEPGFWSWPDVYANALVMQGRLDDADRFLIGHEALAAQRQHRSAQARLASARGRLHGAHGDLEAARLSFGHALTLLESLPLVYDRARVNFCYGQTLRRAGKRADADTVITAAREAYQRLGAATYVARCDRELKAGGVRAVLRDRAAQALTPQEQAVAQLVSSGMTNKEAAAELFLSVKTVQFHLTRAYAKLGIRSRSELAAARATIFGTVPTEAV